MVLQQLLKFRKLREELFKYGINPPMVHIANTGGCLNYDVSDFTIARYGSGIFGINYENKIDRRLHLFSFKTPIISIK